MKPFVRSSVLTIGLSLSATIAPPFLPAAAANSTCSASIVLNAVGDALTSGRDAAVLAAALDGQRRLTACGNERDAIAAELIAADAYGDVNRPVARCTALRDAAQRSANLGDRTRVRALSRALHDCPATRPGNE